MWKRHLDIFPGEWVGTDHEEELKKELEIGDYAKVIIKINGKMEKNIQDFWV